MCRKDTKGEMKPICVNSANITHMYQSSKPRSRQLHHHKRNNKQVNRKSVLFKHKCLFHIKGTIHNIVKFYEKGWNSDAICFEHGYGQDSLFFFFILRNIKTNGAES